jgi:hypothetical protein
MNKPVNAIEEPTVINSQPTVSGGRRKRKYKKTHKRKH